MLPLLLSLHLLAGPVGVDSRLQLLPELHAQTAAQTSSAGSDLHLGEIAIGSAVTFAANGLILGAGFVTAVFLALSMLDGSHNSLPAVIAFVVAAVLVEGVGVPAIAAETVSLVNGESGLFGHAFAGALIGNALGLPLLGGSFLLILTHAINASNTGESLAIVGVGALLQAVCVSVGASLGAHWSGGGERASREPGFEAPRPSAAAVSSADASLDVTARPVAAPSLRWVVPVISVPLG